ncbi:MAG: xanthine dehydrogenase family protein molybdopterin-binding subunit, partial [Streptosporangiaceae bacterium]
MSVIGTRLPRREDPRLLRGRGRFGDDISAPGQLWARIVRSPSAHGQVRELDVTQAAQAPGIATVVTAGDLPGGLAIPVRLAIAGTDLSRYLQPILAADTVRYVGEPLAVVVGDDPYACEDAAELVEIDIAERSVVLDARNADSPVAAELVRGYGDVETAFAQARHVVRIELAIGRHSGVPLEPRCLLAVPDPDRGALSIFGMTKVPVWNRDLLAGLLGMDETLIHVHAIDAGGGFGVRGEFYPEDFLIPWLAVQLRRPVKWAEDRAEHLMAVNHSRQQYHHVAAAFDAGGRILGLTDDIIQDNGAYCRTHGVAVPELTAAMLPGPYRVPAYRGQVRVVLTNKTPCGTYRAPGRFEGTAAREHLLDVAATQLGIDPVELRERNLLTAAEMPHQRPISALGTDLVLDTGDYPALLAAAVKEADRLGYRTATQAAPGFRRGFGLAMFVEKSGLGPQETADVTVSKSGAVHVFSGGTSLGQGIETVMAQITADALGVDPRPVHVTLGDTDAQPFGAGSWASRSTVVGGSAGHQA